MILLMAEILHQLRLVVFPIIYRVSYIPGGCLGFQPSTVSSILYTHIQTEITGSVVHVINIVKPGYFDILLGLLFSST